MAKDSVRATVRRSVCFLGGARYSRPLDETAEKKFKALAPLGDIYVIGFATDWHPKGFSQHAHFLPLTPLLLRRTVFMERLLYVTWCCRSTIASRGESLRQFSTKFATPSNEES